MTQIARPSRPHRGRRRHPHAGAVEIMKAMGINHCCGAQLTLREAAASAGVPLDALLEALEPAAAGRGMTLGDVEARGTGGPAEAGGLAPNQVARHLDVREDIRRGEEPFARIMAAVKALGPEHVLVLRAPFEPIPLYDVLGKRGLAHWTERHAPDDWSVWFYRDAARRARSADAPHPRPRAAAASSSTCEASSPRSRWCACSRRWTGSARRRARGAPRPPADVPLPSARRARLRPRDRRAGARAGPHRDPARNAA